MAARRDKRRTDIAKLLDVYREFGAPAGSAAEQAIWVLLARHGTKEGATRALKALWQRFVDVNELRVAKATEIAGLIRRHVKNDPIEVADQIRGFLRRWHKDQHESGFAVAERMTPDQAKKYLLATEEYDREIALALFLHFCALELERENAETDADGKPKKRAEKDVTTAANRLRLFAAYSAHGKVSANAGRDLLKAWAYAPLPPKEPEGGTTGGETAAEGSGAAKTAAKKKTPPKRKTVKKAGGTTRPRTTRTSRGRRPSKKSSRR